MEEQKSSTMRASLIKLQRTPYNNLHAFYQSCADFLKDNAYISSFFMKGTKHKAH